MNRQPSIDAPLHVMRWLSAGLVPALVALAPLAAQAQQPVVSCVWDQGHNFTTCETTPAGVSTATENGHVVKKSAGVLVGFQVNNWNTGNGLTVMVLDATAIPPNGTLAVCSYTNGTPNTNPCIMKWYGVPIAPSSAQPGTLGANWAPGPMSHFSNGLAFVCSSTGPMTLTLSANCTFSAEIQ
jgi:hypothetical protein